MIGSIERNDRFVLGARAFLIDDSRELAWAEKHVRQDRDIKWILGNFVEANNANDNGHIFPLEDLKIAQQTIPNKPLNMLHHGNYIVGAFAGAELLYPKDGEGASGDAPVGNPYVEALSAFWRHQFPEEYELVRKAHEEAALFYSMEAIPETLTCPEDGCKAHLVPYAGRQSDSYCAHMNAPRGRKVLNKPHFGAGALIVPPVRPGWKRADINELSQILETHAEEFEMVTASEESTAETKSWEGMMSMVQDEYEVGRTFSTQQRQDLAKQGKAMPDGSYPVENVGDLQNAIQSFGRSGSKPAVKEHIVKRANALGRPDLVPKEWKN